MSEIKPADGVWTAGEFCFPIRVYYEDTDLGGMVYHGRYISYFERVRSESIRGTVADVDALLEIADDAGGPLVYVARQVNVTFHRQAKVGDVLLGYSRVERIRAAALEVRQRIERDGELVAEAQVTLAVVGPDGRPKRWPAKTKQQWQDWLDAYSAREEGENA